MSGAAQRARDYLAESGLAGARVYDIRCAVAEAAEAEGAQEDDYAGAAPSLGAALDDPAWWRELLLQPGTGTFLEIRNVAAAAAPATASTAGAQGQGGAGDEHRDVRGPFLAPLDAVRATQGRHALHAHAHTGCLTPALTGSDYSCECCTRAALCAASCSRRRIYSRGRGRRSCPTSTGSSLTAPGASVGSSKSRPSNALKSHGTLPLGS